MISPLASPFRGGWRNLTPMRARGRGGQNPWTPALLAPYAWYDVHAGGTSTTIADTSGNGRADATYGATTAAPLYLPYTGTPYLHLEAAGSGTNSLSCTAPANTASYAAYPLGGGAATTGAASAGAFTFTTAGDWTQLDLLDGSAVVLASFRAADSGQTGHTDAFSVAWTINRGTAGGKSTLVNRRSLALLRTNDYITVPAAMVPSSGSFSVVAVARLWSTSNDNVVVGGKTSGGSNQGYWLRRTTSNTVQSIVDDGTNQKSATVAGLSAGLTSVLTMTFDAGATTVRAWVNNTAGTATTSTGTSVVNGTDVRIGMTQAGTSVGDFEFAALVTFNSVVSSDVISQLVTYYGGGA